MVNFDFTTASGWVQAITAVVVSIMTGLFGAIKIYVRPLEKRLDQQDYHISNLSKSVNQNENEILKFTHMLASQENSFVNSIKTLDKATERLTLLLDKQEDKVSNKMENIEQRLVKIENNVTEIYVILKNEGAL